MASAKHQRLAAIYTADQLARAGAENTDLLNAGFAKGRTDLVGNANEANIALDNGRTAALGALGTGYDAARGEYGQAATLFDPYASSGLAALGQYGDLAGLAGDAGYDRATTAFRASPGFRFAVDEATDGVARKASALGALGSGNTMTAIADRAGNLADQEFGTYANRLQGLTTMGLGATGAQAGLTKGIGDLYAGQGTATANLETNQGLAKAGIRTGLGSSLGNLDTGLATSLANTNMGVATGQSAAVTGAAQASDAAKMANENLLLGVLGSVLGTATGKDSTIGGSMFKGLGSLGKLGFGGV